MDGEYEKNRLVACVESDIKKFDVRSIAKFKQNNAHCEILLDEKSVIIEQPWGTDDTRLVFTDKIFNKLEDLNNIVLNPQFDAIIHLDINAIEFFYAFLAPEIEPSKSVIDRKFTVYFNGIKLECKFEEPSARLYMIANAVTRKPTDRGTMVVPQLKAFKDFQRLKELPNLFAKYFEDKKPRSFFVLPDSNISEIDLPSTCRHLNFLTHYYDRRSPFIEIRDEDTAKNYLAPKPRRYFDSNFPSSLSINSIDDVILKLLEVSRNSSSRYAFLYLYQVF